MYIAMHVCVAPRKVCSSCWRCKLPSPCSISNQRQLLDLFTVRLSAGKRVTDCECAYIRMYLYEYVYVLI